MNNLSESIIPILLDNKPVDTIIDQDLFWPGYEGYSILNTPAAICQMLGVPLPGKTTLDASITSCLDGEVKRIVMVLVDALGFNLFQRWLNAGEANIWQSLINKGVLAPLTSICPSTTSAAITTYWTGAPPAAHGIGGYELWLKEYGLVANMITQNPFHYYGQQYSLENIGFEPEKFLPVTPLPVHLKEHGIKAVSFQNAHILHSGLSRMFMGDAELHPFQSSADQWLSLREYIENSLDVKQYIWTYYPMVDTLSHLHGPDDPRVLAEFRNFSYSFEQEFLNKLSPAAREGTLLLVSADHGQIHTPQREKYNLVNHPKFNQMLHMHPTGENRIPYLFVKPGMKDAVRNYVHETWPEQFYVFESAELLEAGLFGPGEVYPPFVERIGDLILIPRGDAYLWWSAKKDPLHGRHGGLHADEMLVPLIASRLDA